MNDSQRQRILEQAKNLHRSAYHWWESGEYMGSGPSFEEEPESAVIANPVPDPDGNVQVRVTYMVTVPVTCTCGAWPVTEYGDICPSCRMPRKIPRENSRENSARLFNLIEALHAHDELAAEGLQEQADMAQDNSTWDDAPGAEGRFQERLKELADYAAEILSPYVGDDVVKEIEAGNWDGGKDA